MINPKRLKRGIAWLLAVLVIGGSISPPAYRHAHAGGDVAHNHRSQNGQKQVDSHGNGCHCDCHHHAAHHGHASEAPTAHVHVGLPWIELTLPTSDDSDSDPSRSDRDDLPVIVRVIDDYVPNSDGGGDASTHAVTKSPIRSHVVVSSTPSLKHAQPTAPSVLLCDTARHERSGVLRI